MGSRTHIHPLADVQANSIGEGTRIWQFVVILPDAQIGADCNICSHCFIENDVRISDRVTIKNGVQLWNGTRIDDDVFIGPNATLTNDKHPKSGNSEFLCEGIRIRSGASIGAGAVLLPGIEVGERAVIGAGAVVVADVSADSVVVGNPARRIR